MRYFLLGVFVIFCVNNSQANTLPGSIRSKYETYLKEFNNTRGHIPNSPALDSNREKVRTFMKTKFEAAGLDVYEQNFNTNDTNSGKTVSGTNLIAILKGSKYGTPQDEVIVLAAHIDTPQRDAGGVNNDGSGLVGLVTIAEALKGNDSCTRNSSVIFAAFDRSETEVIGAQITQCKKSCGSVEFIKNKATYLSSGKIKLVIVMNCIANYEGTTLTQNYPSAMIKYFNSFVSAAQLSDSVGDFLAITGRNNEKTFLDEMKTTYEASRVSIQSGLFLAEKFQWDVSGVPSSINRTNMNNAFREGDHMSFWDADINAVLLTDTCYQRKPYQSSCSLDKKCDLMDKIKEDDYKFMYSALNTVTKITNKHTCGGACAACDINASCKDNTCVCNSGYSGDGNSCKDIDECKQNTCSQDATCVNNKGSFKCVCKSGYTGNGLNCTVISPASALQVIPQVLVFGLAMLLTYFWI